jgi:hypothetical protein
MEDTMQHASRKSSRLVVSFVALAALLGAMTMVLAQCTMVGDNVTGVGLDRVGPTTCIKQCNDDFAALYKAEQKRHIAAQESCQMIDNNQDRQACQQAESATHEANKIQLSADKTACQNGCYHEGTGSAG